MDEEKVISIMADFVTQVNIINKRCITAIIVLFIMFGLTVISTWAVYQLAPSNYGVITQYQYASTESNQCLRGDN